MYLGLAVCLLFVALVAVPIGRARTGDYFSPPSLFVASWCGTLGLYFLQLLPYRPIRLETFVLIAAVIVTVTCASILTMRSDAPVPSSAPAVRAAHAERWLVGYAVLGLTGTGWYVAEVVQRLGWRAFTEGTRIRAALGVYQIPSGFLFLEYFCIVAPLFAFAVLVSDGHLRRKGLLVAAACALATWLTTDRTQFFIVVLGCFFMYVFRFGRALSWTRMTIALAVAGVLLVTNFLVVGAWMGKTSANLAVRVELMGRRHADRLPPAAGLSGSLQRLTGSPTDRIDQWAARGSTLYLYSTASFAALDVLMEERLGSTRGVYTVYPVARLLERAGVIHGPIPPAIPEDRPLKLRADRDIQFNGYTFLYYPLMDFGPMGAVIYAFFVGAFGGWLYTWSRRRRDSPASLLVIAHLSIALVLSVFVNKFNNTASWYIAGATLLPFGLSSLRSRQRGNSQTLSA
jgi:hypothetical protein